MSPLLSVGRILLAWALTVVTCYCTGRIALAPIGSLLTSAEQTAIAFVFGSACVSLIVFLLGAFWTVHPALYVTLAVVAISTYWLNRGRFGPGLMAPSAAPRNRAITLAWIAFGLLYFVNALAPEVSPDGTAYHLGLAARYAREHRIIATPNNMYGGLSQGIEMLFLFAYVLGGQSAAALLHLVYLAALAILLISLGQRYSLPAVGECAALNVVAAPVVGIDASSAYIDVAAACVGFSCFYLMLLWEQRRGGLLLHYAGCLAGFCYAVKYTLAGAIPFCLGFLVFHYRPQRLRPLAIPAGMLIAGVVVFAAAWPVRNWLWYGNPAAPLFNSFFPNDFVHIDFERRYREHLANWGGLPSKWLIPIEVTVRGFALQGLLGPLFLLAPVALLSMRNSLGRRLVAAVLVFGFPYAFNIGTRFLIPALPFLSFAMLLPFAKYGRAVTSVCLVQAILCCPPVVSLYCQSGAWRLDGLPIRAALRLGDSDAFMNRTMTEWPIIQFLNTKVPDNAPVFSLSGLAESYLTRDAVVADSSATGERLRDSLWSAYLPGQFPTGEVRITFPPIQTRTVRLSYEGDESPGGWGVSEVRVLGPAGELARTSRWLLNANPNPTGVPDAFDNNPTTRWLTWQAAGSGMYLEVDFGGEQTVSGVQLQTTREHAQAAIAVHVRSGNGWTRLPTTVARSSGFAEHFPEQRWWRRAAMASLKREHLDYILARGDDGLAADLNLNASAWGITQVAAAAGWRLYRIDSD